jgi:ferritin-like metal-binding protein YciE
VPFFVILLLRHEFASAFCLVKALCWLTTSVSIALLRQNVPLSILTCPQFFYANCGITSGQRAKCAVNASCALPIYHHLLGNHWGHVNCLGNETLKNQQTYFMATLKDLFLGELADIYDAENRIAQALPKMAAAATDPNLKEALSIHLDETKDHIKKVERVFSAFDEEAQGKECQATVGLLAEGDELVSENEGQPTINAAIIAACQKVEHYEIASYWTLIEWAKLLDNDDAVMLLEEILQEEESADEKLIELSEENNQQALGDDAGETAPASGEKSGSDEPTGN